MRPSRDFGRLKRPGELSLMDLEALGLILRGDSVIDWHRLHFQNLKSARGFLVAQEFVPEDEADRARLVRIQAEAVAYLRRHFEFPIPKPVAESSVEELLVMASGQGHRQLCACTILKAMHIIHHVDGRELLYSIPMADQELFHLVEEKVYRIVGGMLSSGFPIVEFVGGRKNKDSLYTKLLSKIDTSAAAVYDKIRFRIVTRTADDILPVLQYFTDRLFPFNYVVPGQSTNTLLHFRKACERNAALKGMLRELQVSPKDRGVPNDNIFSSEAYRVIHFVVDMPIRLPPPLMDQAPPSAHALGPVIFILCEFQILDQESEASNELGSASHDAYKERQRGAVMRRLKLGTRAMRVPGRR